MTFTIKEVRIRYRVSEHTVLQWIHNGELKAINVSKQRGGKPQWRITEEALENFEQLRQADSPQPKRRRRKTVTSGVEYF